jgi:hypothetical protein
MLGVCVLLLEGGCCSFDRAWRKAAEVPSNANELTGRWEGVWLSDVNAHTGKLRCILTKADDGRYRARFHAKYQKILSFGYTVMLNAERDAQGFKFHGDADLGWLAGGVYTYEGRAGATNFFSTYNCKYDHGTFQMSRE